jgi:hypothetical protein
MRTTVRIPAHRQTSCFGGQEVVELVSQQVDQNTATKTNVARHPGQNRVHNGPCLDPNYKVELSVFEKAGRGKWIRTTDLLLPNQHLSTTYKQRSLKAHDLRAFGLDPVWTLEAKPWRTGLWLDPAWTLISHAGDHVLSRRRAN